MPKMSQEKIEEIITTDYFTNEPGETYIALEEVEFRWTKKQVKEFDIKWRRGLPLEEIAHHFGRTCLETGLLLADRAEKGFCKPRKNGLN
jgi:hypothetical protein